MEKAEPTFLVTLFISALLLVTLFSVTPLSQLASPISAKFPLPSFGHDEVLYDDVFPTSIDQQDDYEESSLDMQSVLPAFDENDVVVLAEHNFSDFVARNQYVMINFYAPWCYFSKKLAPVYAAAATMLKGKAVLAKIDCTQEIELGRMFKIKWYPTVYFLVGGGVQQVLYDPKEERTRNAIVNWVNHKMNIGAQNLTILEDAECVLAAKPVMVLGLLEGPESEELAAVSKLHMDVYFYQTANVDVAKLFHIDEQIKRPSLVLLKREGENHTHFEGQFTRSAIADFVSVYKVPSVITFTVEDASNIFENPMKQLWLFTPDGSCEVLSIFKDTANAFKGKLLFVHVEIGNEGSVGRNLAYEFSVPEDAPRVVAQYNTVDGTKKHVYHGELTLNGIKSFAEQFLEGKFLRTEKHMETVLRLPSHSHTSDPSSFPQTY
ncbi:protein disulfide isomerase, putative [Ricinus communis]|uniref:protein disulfide-isomerase n=1 Tax=Ricinus communis TaxID=3988 RepID=B9SUB3_RICCO|nr:protein disulfide isomerase, putative [Ricinus communis]